jgi:hypothetical protein
MGTTMTQTVNGKAAELRAKTDRQLIQLIDRTVERALQCDENDADATYRSAAKLLTVAYGATYADRRRVELKLARLAERAHAVYASVA